MAVSPQTTHPTCGREAGGQALPYTAVGGLPTWERRGRESHWEPDAHMVCRPLPASVTFLKSSTPHTRLMTATLDAQAQTLFASHVVVCILLEKLLTEDSRTGSMPRVDDCPGAALCLEEGIMAITLNHTIVPAKDKQASAQFFAHIFGLQVQEGEGRFAQVQVNDTLTMDFDQLRPVVESLHYAFHVSDV